MKISMPVVFTKPVFRNDLSVKLEFETREFTGSEASMLMEQRNKEGWLLFSPSNDLTEADIPDEKADPMLGTKTQAQRLRAVIYRLWELKGRQGEYEDYYRSKMENIIDQLKEKLEG